jgi:hypothetical protein
MDNPKTTEPLSVELEAIAQRVAQILIEQRLREQSRRRASRSERLVAAVAAYVGENPQATANEICRAVGGRRQDVLAAVRSLERGSAIQGPSTGISASSRGFPSAGNQRRGSTGDE